MKHAVLTLLIGQVCLSFAGAPQDALTQRVEANIDAMGSTYSVVVYGDDEARLRAAVEDASEEARRLDHLLSNYIPASEWSQLNREAASKPVRVSTFSRLAGPRHVFRHGHHYGHGQHHRHSSHLVGEPSFRHHPDLPDRPEFHCGGAR